MIIQVISDFPQKTNGHLLHFLISTETTHIIATMTSFALACRRLVGLGDGAGLMQLDGKQACGPVMRPPIDA